MIRNIILIGFLVGVARPAIGQEGIETGIAEMGPVVDGLIGEKRMAGAVVLVAKGGQIVHLDSYGDADLEREVPMETDSIFRIHSMSKAITTVAALMLYEEGEFDLDDSVSKYVPAFGEREDLAKITVRSLMRHTSGLAYDFTGPAEVAEAMAAADLWSGDLEAFVNGLAKIPLVHEADAGWTYGVSTDVLGYLVEVWSGQRLDDFFQGRILGPLGMADTGFYLPESKRERLATLYQRKEDGSFVVAEPLLASRRFERPELCSGGGGLVSTAEDYWRFLQMILNGGSVDGTVFLKPETVALMTTNQLPGGIEQIAVGGPGRVGVGFGLGFSVVTEESDDWDADGKLGEFGWGGAASCHYWVSPEDDLIVITLEQTFPYGWDLEWALKGVVYEAVGGE